MKVEQCDEYVHEFGEEKDCSNNLTLSFLPLSSSLQQFDSTISARLLVGFRFSIARSRVSRL